VRPRYGDDSSKPFSGAAAPQYPLLDRLGWSTLLACARLLLISFTTNYGDDNLPLDKPPAHDKVGMGSSGQVSSCKPGWAAAR
jgi:hypothetical protein